MKYKVKQRFRCRLSKEVFETTHLYETKDKERAKELQKLGYLGAEIKEPKKEKTDKK